MCVKKTKARVNRFQVCSNLIKLAKQKSPLELTFLFYGKSDPSFQRRQWSWNWVEKKPQNA